VPLIQQALLRMKGRDETNSNPICLGGSLRTLVSSSAEWDVTCLCLVGLLGTLQPGGSSTLAGLVL
jgi:hypothetical protein